MKRTFFAISLAFIVAIAAIFWPSSGSDPRGSKTITQAQRPALTVEAIQPMPQEWPVEILASGPIEAREEAIVSCESACGRIEALFADEGDSVSRGETIARLSQAIPQANHRSAAASVAQAAARLSEVNALLLRNKALAEKGFLSEQALASSAASAQEAQAALAAARANADAALAQLSERVVLAPESGIILARNAKIGMTPAPGQELFRILARGEMQWRALIPQRDASLLKEGTTATLHLPDSQTATATFRALSPLPDEPSRMAIALFSLSPESSARLGMLPQGKIQVGVSRALTIPLSSLVVSDGSHYAFEIGADSRVIRRKLTIGRIRDGHAEILSGLSDKSRAVLAGSAFLRDGDLIRVAEPATR